MTPVTDPNLIAQLEGSNQGSNQSGSPVTDPNLIAQLEGNTQPNFLQRAGHAVGGYVNSLGGDAANFLSGLTKGAVNTANFLNSSSDPMGAFKIPTSSVDQFFGTQNPGLYGKILQNVGQYTPFAAGGEALAPEGIAAEAPILARMGIGALKQGAIGGAYGATQSQNPVTGAITGALTNSVLGAADPLAAPITDAVKSYLSKYAAQGLAKQAAKTLNPETAISNAQAFQQVKNNYADISAQEGNAWDNVKNQAKIADNTKRYQAQFSPTSPGTSMMATGPSTNLPAVNTPNALIPQTASSVGGETLNASTLPTFDNSGYLQSLNNKLQNLQGQSSRQSGFARANKNSQDLLNDYLNDQHNTFTDAIEHNQALNQDFQNEIAPGQPLPFRTVNFAKKNLQKTINQNIQNNGLQDTLGSTWNNANQITAQKNQLFNTVSSAKGKDQISSFSTFLNGKNPNADPTGFVNDYLPTSRGDGTQKMEQFAQMMGYKPPQLGQAIDPQSLQALSAAKNVLKQNYFDSAIENGTVNPKSFLNKYGNLSTEQQNYLFSPEENQTIQALSKINETHPEALSKNPMYSWGHHGVAATLGGILGMSTGHGLWEGLGVGILGGMAANAGLRKLFENPTISRNFVNYLNQGSKPMTGAFTSRLAPFITPTATNMFAGSSAGGP